jgi:hypothetical protein
MPPPENQCKLVLLKGHIPEEWHESVAHQLFFMASQTQTNMREWVILCHNIRGLNSENKWNSIRNKVRETNCEIICLQETKSEHFDE